MNWPDTALGVHTGVCCASTLNQTALSDVDCELAVGDVLACGGHFLRLVDTMGVYVWTRLKRAPEPERVLTPTEPEKPVRFMGLRVVR